jgi:hypothetical protein
MTPINRPVKNSQNGHHKQISHQQPLELNRPCLELGESSPLTPQLCGKESKEDDTGDDALPSPHKPGEVDNPKLVPFIVKSTNDLRGVVGNRLDIFD